MRIPTAVFAHPHAKACTLVSDRPIGNSSPPHFPLKPTGFSLFSLQLLCICSRFLLLSISSCLLAPSLSASAIPLPLFYIPTVSSASINPDTVSHPILIRCSAASIIICVNTLNEVGDDVHFCVILVKYRHITILPTQDHRTSHSCHKTILHISSYSSFPMFSSELISTYSFIGLLYIQSSTSSAPRPSSLKHFYLLCTRVHAATVWSKTCSFLSCSPSSGIIPTLSFGICRIFVRLYSAAISFHGPPGLPCLPCLLFLFFKVHSNPFTSPLEYVLVF